MLEQFMPRLIQELELSNTTLSAGIPGSYAIPLEEGLTINLTESPNGFLLSATIAPFPKGQEEFFATQAMLANLFGQGTRGAVLGLTPDGNTLTIAQMVDFPVNYKEFRDILEDFINAVDFWRDEAKS